MLHEGLAKEHVQNIQGIDGAAQLDGTAVSSSKSFGIHDYALSLLLRLLQSVLILSIKSNTFLQKIALCKAKEYVSRASLISPV